MADGPFVDVTPGTGRFSDRRNRPAYEGVRIVSKAFLSHSTPDDRYVTELEQFVRGLGYDEVFNDGHSIQPDEEFWARIEAGIRDCDAFVVVLSHASVASHWVDREVQFARAEAKRVIPIRIDDCKLPASFDGRDVVDLRPGRGDRFKFAPSRILRHSPAKLFGRDTWLDDLDVAWANRDRVHVYTLVAWGGVGKTSLVAHWIGQRMTARGWPDVERYFDWSFYSQGTGESRQTSSDLFIDQALRFFGDDDPTVGSPWERGQRLAGLVQRYRTLLVLDGIEPLQYPIGDPQAGRLKDQGLEALLQGLAADNAGLCVVTTRESLANLQSFRETTAPEKHLDRLPLPAAVDLLDSLHIVGTPEEIERVWHDVDGHALTLQLLGRYLADAHGGDLRKIKDIDFEAADRERQGRSAFKVMRAYERWLQGAGAERQRELAILRLTGLFDRPISPDCLADLRAWKFPSLVRRLCSRKWRQIAKAFGPIMDIDDAEWKIALKRLSSIDLISHPTSTIENQKSKIENPIDAHPLVREYFAVQLRERQPEAFRAAHSRLFDHLCETTKPHQPDTLDGLQPLYQAVVHGCLAQRQPDACVNVYRDRILRGTGPSGNYSTFKLGAIGADLAAVAAFFDVPWTGVSPNLSEEYQAWLLNEAATRLRALGRLTEALEPMRAVTELTVKHRDWKNAAIDASNLSELEVTLGRLGEAAADARRAIDLADRLDDRFEQQTDRVIAADALHQAGEPDEARTMFEEAEIIQRQRQPNFHMLYSGAGFRYCDLLLGPAERAAWQTLLNLKSQIANPKSEISILEPSLAALAEVERRTTQTLAEHPTLSLLSIALDHLTLARVAIYRAILQKSNPKSQIANRKYDNPHLAPALNGLRQAGTIHHMPKALLTSALHHHVTGDAAAARRDLDEAQQIAARGPMPLYLADVALCRARFRIAEFGSRKDELTESEIEDLNSEIAQARSLIQQHGYGRRLEELADAEAAAEIIGTK